jgi:ribonuclease HI
MKKLRRAGAKSTSKTDGQDLKTVNIVTERRKGQVVKHDISSKVLTLASVSNQAPLPFKIHIHSTIEAYSYASLVYASPQGPLVQEFGPHHLVMWTDGTNPVYSKRLQAFAVVYRTEPLILGQEQSGWHEWAFTGNVQSNKIITTLETMAVHNALGVAVREVSRHREKLDKAANHISKVTIFTDSQNTLTGLLTGNLGSLGASIVKYADMLVTKGITVDLRWVPSHATVPGNEAADRLALLASQFGPLPQNDAFVRVPVPLLRICARQFATAEVWCRGLNTAVVKPFLEVQKRELREALGRAGVEEGWGDLLV